MQMWRDAHLNLTPQEVNIFRVGKLSSHCLRCIFHHSKGKLPMKLEAIINENDYQRKIFWFPNLITFSFSLKSSLKLVLLFIWNFIQYSPMYCAANFNKMEMYFNWATFLSKNMRLPTQIAITYECFYPVDFSWTIRIAIFLVFRFSLLKNSSFFEDNLQSFIFIKVTELLGNNVFHVN